MIRILFVCMGNICRSPLAEGVFRHRIAALGMREGEDGDCLVDSAGTGGWHAGSPPDPRSVAVAKRHAIDIAAQRARKIAAEDFDDFDYILAMDRDNLHALETICPDERRERLHLLMSFAKNAKIKEVPDPYYFRDDAGFERILSTIMEGIDAFIDHLTEQDLLRRRAG